MDTPLSSPDALITLDTQAGVAIITLNRPKQYNALSAATLEALHQALDTLNADPSVRVVVIAANGNAFCAGHDLKEMKAANDDAFVRRLFQRCSEMMLKSRFSILLVTGTSSPPAVICARAIARPVMMAWLYRK